MNDPLATSAWIDDEQRLRLMSELVGVRLDRQRLPDIAAYLTEVRQLGDELLDLDLHAAFHEAEFDPRWTESEG